MKERASSLWKAIRAPWCRAAQVTDCVGLFVVATKTTRSPAEAATEPSRGVNTNEALLWDNGNASATCSLNTERSSSWSSGDDCFRLVLTGFQIITTIQINVNLIGRGARMRHCVWLVQVWTGWVTTHREGNTQAYGVQSARAQKLATPPAYRQVAKTV